MVGNRPQSSRFVSPLASCLLSMQSSCLLSVQKQKSDAHVDLAAYDHATMTVAAALSGHEGGAQLSELPMLPVAPWNRRPGYLVGSVLSVCHCQHSALQAACFVLAEQCMSECTMTCYVSPGELQCTSPPASHLCMCACNSGPPDAGASAEAEGTARFIPRVGCISHRP
jgi:hypothetical protein